MEEATAIIHAMPAEIEAQWLARFAAKIGISTPGEDDVKRLEHLLALMQEDGADFTNTFRALGTETARDQFVNRDAFDAWHRAWTERVEQEPDPDGLMARSNPAVIPRNHRVEEMIEAAVAGDMAPFERLSNALATPFTVTDPDLHRPPTSDEIVPATFCGT